MFVTGCQEPPYPAELVSNGGYKYAIALVMRSA